ncbi:coiled-coil domain-containing protein 73 [Rhinophrynus dorsalis]
MQKPKRTAQEAASGTPLVRLLNGAQSSRFLGKIVFVMDDDGINKNILSVQLLEFKTSLLEAVEELRMGRAVKIQYEEQICKVQMEKQDLAWQNETLSNQAEVLEKQHKEAIAALKKQANFQLGAETKGKEICLLKEELKTLQMSKYNLQKKLQEMEQKSQLHILAKEDHIKQLSEFEKCFAAITCQFGMVKEAHEKLEQNVQEAIQQNQKLRAENKERGAESERLKEELKILSTDLINYKVTCQKRAGEETISLFEKDQQLRELQNKLLMEAEINKKLTEVNQSLKEEKQEVTSSLHHMLELIQRHVQTITNLETQLATLTADYETLERDNELQRAKARENEEKFLALQSEHEKALIMWKKQVDLQA